MSRKYKVLQLQLRYNVSASDLAEQVVRGLSADAFDVTTAFLRGSPEPGQPESCAPRTVYFGFKQSDLKGLKRLRALWALYKHCRNSSYDVIIAHRFKPMNMVMWLNRCLKIRACIGVQHGIGDFDRFFRRWEARWLMTANWRVVGVSRAVKDYLLDSGFGRDSVVQINNAIDIDRAERMQHPRDEARKILGLANAGFVFGAIGRLVPVKGHIHLIEAFASISSDYPEACVAIIGEGRSRNELEAAIKRHGLQGRVHLLGAMGDALQYVRAFDAFAMPSISEGLPLALLEGMSGRIPVIGSDIESTRRILQDCGGRSFPAGDVKALSESLREVLSLNESERRAEGEHVYTYFHEAHSIENFRRDYQALVAECLDDEQCAETSR